MSIGKKSLITILIFIFSSFAFAKSFERRARVIHIDSETNWKKSWYDSSKGKAKSLQSVVRGLRKSKTGRTILEKASRKAAIYGQSLYDIIDAGESSLTDTTLIRKFSPDNPLEIAYETRSKVFLNKDLSYKDAVLDLAHELVHYSYREPFNPYLTQFTVDQFVSSVIEGRGGEVDAYIVECRVLKEIKPTTYRNNSNCQSVVDPNSGHLSKRIGVKKFYEVGKYDGTLQSILNKYGWKKSKFPKLGSGEALYISSAYGVPYPVAAVSEFTTIMGKACENDHKRLAIMRDSFTSGSGRTPASDRHQSFKSLYASYKSRCSQFTP